MEMLINTFLSWLLSLIISSVTHRCFLLLILNKQVIINPCFDCWNVVSTLVVHHLLPHHHLILSELVSVILDKMHLHGVFIYGMTRISYSFLAVGSNVCVTMSFAFGMDENRDKKDPKGFKLEMSNWQTKFLINFHSLPRTFVFLHFLALNSSRMCDCVLNYKKTI